MGHALRPSCLQKEENSTLLASQIPINHPTTKMHSRNRRQMSNDHDPFSSMPFLLMIQYMLRELSGFMICHALFEKEVGQQHHLFCSLFTRIEQSSSLSSRLNEATISHKPAAIYFLPLSYESNFLFVQFDMQC